MNGSTEKEKMRFKIRQRRNDSSTGKKERKARKRFLQTV